MAPIYFDAHSHLNFPEYDDDRDQVVRKMEENGVWTITVGVNSKTSKEAISLSKTYSHIFATVGLHPNNHEEGFNASLFSDLIAEDRVVGVGECGLDYFRIALNDDEAKRSQKEIFQKQIEFALDKNLPLMLHMRPHRNTMDAYEDGLDILKSYSSESVGKLRGNSHFFAGDQQVAREFLNLDFTISFDGPITFTKEYDDVVKFVPLDMILSETDSPYASPEPHRRRRNEPSHVKYVVKAISRIRNEDEEAVKAAVVDNAKRIFNIS